MILRKAYNILTSRHKQTNLQFYSMFPTTYVLPIYKNDEQEQLNNTPEGKKLSHIPIRPALTSDTCSEFHDKTVRKFTNYIMKKGKKSLAIHLLEKTFETIKIAQLEKYYDGPPEEKDHIILDPKIILHRAIENCTPILELTNVRRGGITYKVPVPLSEKRAKFLSMNWLIEHSKERTKKDKFTKVLAKELIDAANNVGRTVKRKHDLHKQCEANRAYAHYRWL